MSAPWTHREIESNAKELALRIRKVAERARNEEELRIETVQALADFTRAFGFNLEGRHEYTIAHGRADSVYGRVIIEFEPPKSLTNNNGSPANRHAVEQVQRYALGLHRDEGQSLSRILGIVLDGYRIIFIRHRKAGWEVSPPRDVEQATVAELLFCLVSLQGKALVPENLVADFGAGRGGVSGECVAAFYEALVRSSNPKVRVLFQQWKLLFSEVCGYGLESTLDVKELGGLYGLALRSEHVPQLFFCVHTYYAMLLKLLAAEIVTFYSAQFLPSYLGKLEGLNSEGLKRELTSLEDKGGVLGQLGLRNFLEGDFFAWYLQAWDEPIGEALRSLVRLLRHYDPGTMRVDPEQSRDLLKQLYQFLVPKKLRHALGEYYTPDWLAELVLDEVGYEGDLKKRILDPACGSGTFLVAEIKRAREWAQDHFVNETETLERILNCIVGFDLNPLAVITARTNYLLALGELLKYRKGDIEIPVYLCDAILTPTAHRQMTIEGLPLETAVGTFRIPHALATREGVSNLATLLEQAVQAKYKMSEFLTRAKAELGLEQDAFEQAEVSLKILYEKFSQLAKEGRNGIWARIIKNSFAPVFAGRFNYVAGNPPWIGWETLPAEYRANTQSLWVQYGLFTLKGQRARLGGGKKDLSALFTFVAADKYLSDRGRLCFLLTESLFKSSGAGDGFRRFQLPAKPGEYPTQLKVERVHDLVDVKPFEGASNRTAILLLVKGEGKTPYPVQYVVWRRPKGKRVNEGLTLAEVKSSTQRIELGATPIVNRSGAPWITGPASAVAGAIKAIGKSPYRAWAGATTWLNGVYWLRILQQLPDGTVLVQNLTDAGEIPVDKVERRIEADLVYPLLKQGEVRNWRAAPRDYILLVQDPVHRVGYSERDMKVKWPLTYQYLLEFEERLRKRPGLVKYFQADASFYSMYNVGSYTLSPIKVVWPQMYREIMPAVIGPLDGKAVIPQHTVTFVPFKTVAEAHYFCALMGSSIAKFISANYSTGKSYGAPHVLQYIRIPKFNPGSSLHLRLSKLSEVAHEAARAGDQESLARTETEIHQAAAELWGISRTELRAIQSAWKETRQTSAVRVPSSGELDPP